MCSASLEGATAVGDYGGFWPISQGRLVTGYTSVKVGQDLGKGLGQVWFVNPDASERAIGRWLSYRTVSFASAMFT